MIMGFHCTTSHAHLFMHAYDFDLYGNIINIVTVNPLNFTFVANSTATVIIIISHSAMRGDI